MGLFGYQLEREDALDCDNNAAAVWILGVLQLIFADELPMIACDVVCLIGITCCALREYSCPAIFTSQPTLAQLMNTML